MNARDVDSLFYTLIGDVIAAMTMGQERGDQFSHRLFVRTVFASAQGIIQVMKSAALLFDELNEPSVLTAAEILLLQEQVVHIRNNGKIEFKKKKVSLLPNFQFAFLTYAKVLGEEVTLDKSGHGWQSLGLAITIRDKLTHPHAPKDLQVSLEDLQVVEEGMEFFRNTTAQLLRGRNGP